MITPATGDSCEEWLIKYMYGRRQKQVKLKLSNELNQAEQWFFKQEENLNTIYRIIRSGVQIVFEANKRSERLAGMNIEIVKITNLPPVTMLSGRLTDQAELLGVLNALYNLRITLMTVKRLD